MPVRGGGNAAYMEVDNWWEEVNNATPSEAFVKETTSFAGLYRPWNRLMSVQTLSPITE